MMDNCYYSAGPSNLWAESEKENYNCSAASAAPGSSSSSSKNLLPTFQNLWNNNNNNNYKAAPAPIPPTSTRIQKSELETLVTFLSKFDSKVAAIWDNGNVGTGSGTGTGTSASAGDRSLSSGIWEDQDQETESGSGSGSGISAAAAAAGAMEPEVEAIEMEAEEAEEEEDLLISPKTHFKPIRDYREEIRNANIGTQGTTGNFLPLPQKDPAEYAIYHRTAAYSYPLLFQLKPSALNDKAVQANEDEILGATATEPPNWFLNLNLNLSVAAGGSPSLTPSPSFSSGTGSVSSISVSSESSSTCSSPPLYFTAAPGPGPIGRIFPSESESAFRIQHR